MKLSAPSCHAVQVLLELARRKDRPPVQASWLSGRLGVSVRFIEKVVRPLKEAGLVASLRGAAGGYSLSRSPESISLAEVVRAMDGAFFRAQCREGGQECGRSGACLLGRLWNDMAGLVERELSRMSLAALLAESGPDCLLLKARGIQGRVSAGE
jgi:Rrf2 family protein